MKNIVIMTLVVVLLISTTTTAYADTFSVVYAEELAIDSSFTPCDWMSQAEARYTVNKNEAIRVSSFQYMLLLSHLQHFGCYDGAGWDVMIVWYL